MIGSILTDARPYTMLDVLLLSAIAHHPQSADGRVDIHYQGC